MKWSTVGRVALTVVTALAVPLAVAAFGIARATGEIYTNRNASAPPVSVDAVAAPVHDPAKPTAVIVLSLQGTNVADATNRPHANGLATSERCSMDRAPAARTRTFPTLR
jgi:hypothetical protein